MRGLKFIVLGLALLLASYSKGMKRTEQLPLTVEPQQVVFDRSVHPQKQTEDITIATSNTLDFAVPLPFPSTRIEPPAVDHPLNSAADNPVVTINHRYYPIKGKTATELRSQMSQKGPFDQREGRHYDAKTDWTVQWWYKATQVGNQCVARSVKTNVNITLTYPQWAFSTQDSPSLREDWQRYLAALEIHENGHKDHGIAAGKEILKTLLNFPAYPSCQELETAVRQTTQAISHHYNQKDLSYDAQTGHGSVQGAVFPDFTTVSQ